ncbi:up-regulator of cell proliferation-like [Trachemys scripta elegans]|uniref:up-regulator of cell proliferation-like n=1 Tax=Trachemys scripta elegans TaxID=31138 RepID=UPI001554FFD1|nr:up-regulator of cell proliferation-like [Trachemys scripta elegans]
MAKTLRDHLLLTLEDLGEDELKKFKFKLHEMPLKEGYEHIGRGTLKKVDVIDLTDKLISCYEGNYAVEVTVEALKSINERDLAEKLAKATGNDALNSKQESDTQQDPELEEKDLFKERRGALQDLLAKLKMEKHRSTKLGLRDLQEIHPESLQNWSPRALGDLPWHFLRKVIALNGTARNTSFGQGASADKTSSDDNGGQGDGGNVLHYSNMDARASVHPLDVLCAVLLCSDSFLQQEILSKMSMCQFALPLLLPALDTPRCTLMLWAMRDIVRKWRPHSLAESRGFREESLVLTAMPTISFVRLGSCSFSKSKLLNEVLSPSQQHHNFFIHRDMESGNVPREIADGLVEISWYFPAGNEDSDLFPEPVAVTNLRGDIESHWLQFRFLTEISSAVFILTESINEREYALLSSLQGSATKYYFILNYESGKQSETQEFLNKLAPVLKLSKQHVLEKEIGTKKEEFMEKLCSAIGSIMNDHHKDMNMEGMAVTARELGIHLDEDCEECQRAKNRVNEITAEIKDVGNYKRQTLQLQGDLWKSLSNVEREMCRLKGQGDVPTEEYKSRLKEKLLELRTQQNKCDLTDGLTKFISGIGTLSQMEIRYFLKCMKFNLDGIAKGNRPNLQPNEQKLPELDESISASSLGVEHFLRELGQFYEAEHSMVKEGKMGKIQRKFIHFPRLAADLMLEGFPMELIDGDVSNIPLQWVTDVLTELHAKLGGKSKMLVLTVLGGQSTGKSTLLNTMFGLQFAVSSGRCMRGAFMSLIKVAENFQQELGCDFILVIDTEGLKAPELAKLEDSYQHDSELATLVVGLSDITIVNLAMENATKMQDVLQIVVHAFLRMEETEHMPICQFVHQNVNDVAAYEQNMRDKKYLVEQLNEMTVAAAKMEKLQKEITVSDIMDHDPEKHNWYIPSQWHGDPPMAPVNTGYSESVGGLKKCLFEFVRQHSLNTIPKDIPQFIEWVKSLWNALKHDDFLFSFRNPFTTEAYTKIAAKSVGWEWEFRKEMNLWVTEKQTFFQNQPPAKLDAHVLTNLTSETQQKVSCESHRIWERIQSAAVKQSVRDKNTGDFVRYSRPFAHHSSCYSRAICSNLVTASKGWRKKNTIQATCIKTIEGEMDMLLEDCKMRENKVDNKELEMEFEEMWSETVSKIRLGCMDEKQIYQDIELLLREDLAKQGNPSSLKLQEYRNLLNYGTKSFIMKKEYLDLPWIKTLNEWFTQECWHKTEELVKSLMEQCKDYIRNIADSEVDYDEIYSRNLLRMINERLQEADVQELHTSACFKVDLKLHILGEVVPLLEKMQASFIKENDPELYLEKLKPQYLSTFKDLYLGKDSCQTRARDFCHWCLKPALVDYVNNRLGLEIVDDILNSGQYDEYTNRSLFQFTVLKKLLKYENFDTYILYINNYERFVKIWVEGHLLDRYSQTARLRHLEKEILSSVIKQVRTALESLSDKSTSTSDFLDTFCGELQKDLVISKDHLAVVRFKNTANAAQFSAHVQAILSELEKETLAEFEELKFESKLSNLSVKPQDEIFNCVFGCGKQCPFCKVPCEAGCMDHTEHFATVHRPQGLGQCKNKRTGMLEYSLCSSDVVSNAVFRNSETEEKFHPYKDYRRYYPEWRIQPDPSIDTSDYWKFVFNRFNYKFAKKYKAKPANLPQGWKKITKEQALESLEEAFNIKQKNSSESF